jgi:integrase
VAEQRDFLLTSPIPPKGRTDEPDAVTRMRSPSTVVRYLAVLSHVFSVARREWGWATDNPVSRVTRPKEPRGRVRYLNKDELETLLDACQGSRCTLLYAIVVLAVSTGMRLGEMLSLRWDQVDFEHDRIVLHETKNGERRAVPLLHHARDVLSKLPNNGPTALVFPGRKPTKPICIHKAWERALQAAGISDFRFHDLRHTAASHLAMQGASPLDIAQVLGHRTLQMVRRYAHLSDGHVRSVVERMNGQLFAMTDPDAAPL